MQLAIALHVVAAVIWVGGMFFAFACMRPTLNLLDPQLRLRMWAGTLSRFFKFVWVSIAVLLITGVWMVFGHFHGIRQVGAYVHLMLGIGIVMMLLAAHVYFAPYKRLKRLIARSQWSEATHQVQQIRLLIAINLTLGFAVLVIASAGRYMP
ncbi:MAG TPA: CopD family protein [Nevskiaceae bacterium]|nr:CopD family protein [Nevskiaceae bacterium]